MSRSGLLLLCWIGGWLGGLANGIAGFNRNQLWADEPTFSSLLAPADDHLLETESLVRSLSLDDSQSSFFTSPLSRSWDPWKSRNPSIIVQMGTDLDEDVPLIQLAEDVFELPPEETVPLLEDPPYEPLPPSLLRIPKQTADPAIPTPGGSSSEPPSKTDPSPKPEASQGEATDKKPTEGSKTDSSPDDKKSEPETITILGPVLTEYWVWLQGSADRWTERLEFGGTFLEGNTKQETFNTAARFTRESEDSKSQINLGGQYSQSHGLKTANRWFGDTTTDFKQTGNWIYFIRTLHGFNEFERLDYRGTGSFGFGYRFLNESSKKLIVRTGPGVTVEVFHNPIVVRTTADWFAEFEAQWPIGKRMMLEEKATVNPSLENMQLVRVLNTAGLVIPLDEQKRWNLKFGFRYDYNGKPPENRVPSDYTTTVNIVYARK